MERLEDRALLAIVSWIKPEGGLWESPANWSTGALPGIDDDVVIDLLGTITVEHASGVHTVKSLRCAEALQINGGSIAHCRTHLLKPCVSF